ncbi:MAG: acyl-CoA dehydrogenase [Hyphomicrobiales bacterium]|jgi:acyl-CoA dehydrogenase|nr:acyl-CoA dehydrogenase [Hyphomicrobiales bacterium]
MDFALNDEQRLLVETARRFVRTELMPLEGELERTRVLPPETAREIFEKSKALGLYAVNIPAEYGGGGLSAVDTCLAEEQFGHTTDILIRRAFGNVYEVLLLANDLQRKRWLEPAVRGERTFSVCFTEPEAGSDAAGIKSRAVREGDGWLLTGQKIFISDGAFSDFFVVSAVTDPEKGAKGISLFILDKDMPGFTPGRDQPMMGLAGTSHLELFFDNVRLGPEHLLGQEGRGLNHAFETLGRIRLAQIGARAAGKATRILDLMTEYARERRQFGKPIGEQQLVQQMLADSAIEINAARLLVLHAASDIDRGLDARERISMVKVYAAEMLGRVADRAVQVYGGLGYCKDLPIERFYRDARIFRIFDGTSEIHRTVIARSMLKHGAARFADII